MHGLKMNAIDVDEYKFEGLPSMIRHSLSIIDADARKDVTGSIVVTGGTTQTDGFKERLATELEKLPNVIFF